MVSQNGGFGGRHYDGPLHRNWFPTDPGQRAAWGRIRKERELASWLSVFAKADRILSGHSGLHVAGVPAPRNSNESWQTAWTDGDTIFFNADLFIKKIIETVEAESRKRNLAGMLGLNYHELSHVLFTPPLSGVVATEAKKRATQYGPTLGGVRQYPDAWEWWAFNALEDQRCEALFCGMYGPASGLFRVMVLDHILSQPASESDLCWPLLVGRLYLPKAVRAGYLGKWGSTHALNGNAVAEIDKAKRKIEHAVKTYLPLDLLDNSPTTNRVAIDAIVEMAEAMRMLKDKGNNGQGQSQGGALIHRGFGMPQGYASDEFTDGTSDSQRSSPHVNPTKVKRESVDPGLKDAVEAAIKKDDQDGEEESQDGKPGQGKQGKQGGNTRDAAADALADALASGDLVIVVESIQSAAQEAVSSGAGQQPGSPLSWVSRTPTKHSQVLVRDLGEQFRTIRMDLEPKWVRSQPTGRLDANKAGTMPYTLDLDIFDSYDEGNEGEGGFEVVVLIDRSGSMVTTTTHRYGGSSPIITIASEVMWAIKRVCDGLDAPCTVLAYSTDNAVVFTKKDKAGGTVRSISPTGGTNPLTSLKKASEILLHSPLRHRILVTVTDGEWESEDENRRKALMSAMHSHNVKTVLVGLDDAVKSHGNKGFQHFGDVKDVGEVTDIFSGLVRRMLSEAAGPFHDD